MFCLLYALGKKGYKKTRITSVAMRMDHFCQRAHADLCGLFSVCFLVARLFDLLFWKFHLLLARLVAVLSPVASAKHNLKWDIPNLQHCFCITTAVDTL